MWPAWPQLWWAPLSRAPDSSEFSPPVALMCPLPSSLMALCSHLPGLSCREPRVQNHWISRGLAFWFQYKVAVVCCPPLSAKTNQASPVVGPGALSTSSCCTLQSSLCAKFLLSVIQALCTVTGLTSVEANSWAWSNRSPRAQLSSFSAKSLPSVTYNSVQ